MAVEKAKVLAALNAKFKGKTSVSKELKESYATRWAQHIDTDDDIQDFVDGREEDVLDAAKYADRRANAAEKLGREKAAQAASGKTETEETQEEEPESPAGTPDWAKMLFKQHKELVDKVKSFEASRTAETLGDRFRKDDRLKDVPEAWIKRAIPQSEEGFEQAVTELLTDYTAYAEEHQLNKFGNERLPAVEGAAVARTGATSGKVDSDIVAFGKQQAATATTKTA